MCGIAGYVGGKNAPKVLFDMLSKLEYRGYDSAGIAYISMGKIEVPKEKGRVDEVKAKLNIQDVTSNIGVGHTRWATHGAPSKVNSHPHQDCSGNFVVAHNGIIENYEELKLELIRLGHKFKSETDTEVIAHLIEEYFNGDFLGCFPKVLKRLRGSYALVVLVKCFPDTIFFARKDSPLLIGYGKGENYIASDAPAFLDLTKKAAYVEDDEYGFIRKDKVEYFSVLNGRKVMKKTFKIRWDVTQAQKRGYHHFMLKEIHEEPHAAANALKEMKSILQVALKMAKHKRVYFVGCGTAYHAGLYGKYILESFGLPAESVHASEFRYSTVETVDDKCVVLSISQSGETADTLAAIKQAKRQGAYVASIVNVVGSSITRFSDDVVYIHSGPEIAVASTKAYVGQLVAVAMICLECALKMRKVTGKKHVKLKKELMGVGKAIKVVLDANNIRGLAEEYANTQTFFYVGRGENYPTALEGALKLKEISYVHAEGYAGGELKHGPLALMDEKVVVIAIHASDNLKPKMESNIQEIKARGAKVIDVGEGGLI
ncbi:MAG: glutamine--fructose-6-phosphate transaminase (isomerizing), partial [Candidatus Altiarchaeota archaeon]|nr:glutamine--fructose-6-phosphate transaminase (isomerizing) [Candidatus Altiarchaeota archaeon]